MRQALHEKNGEGRDESKKHGQRAACRRGIAPPSLEIGERNGAIAPGGVVELAFSPRRPLGHQQRRHEQQRHQRDLRRSGQARALQPRHVDAHRQRRDAEVLHGAEIVEALHQCQRHARGERRPCQRQRHRPEGAGGRPPQCARHFQHADRLLHEARPCREINVRVEHHRQDQDGAGQRAHLGEPVVLDRVPAEQAPQRALHGAREIEQLDVGVGDDVGRHGERQHQQAVQQAAAGEAVHGGEPGRPGADQQAQSRRPRPAAAPCRGARRAAPCASGAATRSATGRARAPRSSPAATP